MSKPNAIGDNPISGTWISKVGSTLVISETNGALTGTFQSTESTGTAAIFGSADPDARNNARALAFSAYWSGTSPYVTSYTGICKVDTSLNHIQEIEVVFMIAGSAAEGFPPLWQQTNIGFDTFKRRTST